MDKKVWLAFVACYNTVAVIFLASGGTLHTSSCDVYYCDMYYSNSVICITQILEFQYLCKEKSCLVGFFFFF